MAKKFLFMVGVVCLFSFKSIPLTQNYTLSVSGYGASITLTAAEVTALTDAYSKLNPGATLGGKIGKSELLDLVNSIPDKKDYVHFRFGIDPQFNSISLMFCGDKTIFQNESNVLYKRNGASASAYCPTSCDLENANGVTVNSNSTEYKSLNAVYEQKYPGKTLGGNIDKSAVLNIINSLPPATNVVNFRFCKDAQTGNTSVIFIGENLFIRNGGSSAAYCPTSCD